MMSFSTLYNWYRKRRFEIFLITGKFWSGTYSSFLYVPLIAFLRDTWSASLKFSRSGCIPTLTKHSRFVCSWALCISKHSYLKPKCMAPLSCLMEYSKGHKKGLHFYHAAWKVLQDQAKEPSPSAQVVGMTLLQLFSQLPLKWQSSKMGTKGTGRGGSAKSVFLSHGPLTKYTLERSQFTVGASQT